MSIFYGPQLPTQAGIDAAYEDWGDAMHAEDEARAMAQATAQAAGHREPATAAEAWTALTCEGPGADAVASYLAPGPQARYDTPQVRAEAQADMEAGS